MILAFLVPVVFCTLPPFIFSLLLSALCWPSWLFLLVRLYPALCVSDSGCKNLQPLAGWPLSIFTWLHWRPPAHVLSTSTVAVAPGLVGRPVLATPHCSQFSLFSPCPAPASSLLSTFLLQASAHHFPHLCQRGSASSTGSPASISAAFHPNSPCGIA